MQKYTVNQHLLETILTWAKAGKKITPLIIIIK